MNDNTPTSVQWNDNPNGTVSFATDVVAKMAGLAATEVEGVASMAGNNNGIADIFSRRMMQNSRNFTKGVKIAIENNRVLVDVSIIIEYGSTVPDVAANIQENVKKAIETMSGLDVQSVDVHIQGLSFEKENRAAQELEEQQLLCFHLEGSDVLGYAVATTGKYPEIERVRTSLNKLVSRGGSIYLAYLLPFKGSTYLFLSLNENLSEIRHTYGNTTVSYPVEDGIPAAIFIPLVNGHQTYAFFDKHGNELE